MKNFLAKVFSFFLVFLLIAVLAILWYIGSNQKPNQEALKNLGLDLANSSKSITSSISQSSVQISTSFASENFQQFSENQKLETETVIKDFLLVDASLRQTLEPFVIATTNNYRIFRLPKDNFLNSNLRLKTNLLTDLVKNPAKTDYVFYLLNLNTNNLEKFTEGLLQLWPVYIQGQENFLVLLAEENYNQLYLVDRQWQKYNFVSIGNLNPLSVEQTDQASLFKVRVRKVGRDLSEENYYLDILKFFFGQTNFYYTEAEWKQLTKDSSLFSQSSISNSTELLPDSTKSGENNRDNRQNTGAIELN